MSFEDLLRQLEAQNIDGPLIISRAPGGISVSGLLRYAGQIICEGWSDSAFQDQKAFKTFWTPELLGAAKTLDSFKVAMAMVAWLESLGHKVNSIKELRSAMLKESRKNASKSSIQSLATNLSPKEQQFLLFLEENPKSSHSEIARKLWPGENVSKIALRNRINGLVHAVNNLTGGINIERLDDGDDRFLLFSYTPVIPRHN